MSKKKHPPRVKHYSDLKRRVLSEDGVYNLLEHNKEIMDVLKPYLTEDETDNESGDK